MHLHHPLADLSRLLIERGDRLGQTPVLMLDRNLRITDKFANELLGQLLTAAERNVRIEIIQAAPIGVLSGRLFSPSGWRIRQLRKLFERSIGSGQPARVSVETRLVLSRPAGVARPIVIGVCDRADLIPIWGHPVQLTHAPTLPTQFQLVGI